MDSFKDIANVINDDNFGAGGGGKGGGGSSGGNESPNTLRSKAIADLLYLLGEGEIEGVQNATYPLRSVIINKVPFENNDGSHNFNGVNIWTRTGTATQTGIPGFDQASSENQVGQRVRQAIPVVYRTQGDQLDSVVVTLDIPALTKLDDQGNLTGSFFNISIDIRSLGDAGNVWVTVATDYQSGKCTSPYEKSYRIPLAGTTGPWLIRMNRLNGDDDDNAKIRNETYFSHVTEISEWSIAYADSAVVAIEIDSEALGQSVDIQFDIKGKKINYPSNYNPLTGVNTGFWDGTFAFGWCNNPAWVLMDVCSNPRYGIGIPMSSIDKWGLYQLAQYCDEVVPDGFGGTERRFLFNGTFYTQEEAYKTIQAICSMMRAVAFYAAGAVMVRQDRPVLPQERVYSPANVVGDFNYSSSARTVRHNACVVEWVNPASGYENDYEVYEDRDAILKYGYLPLTIRAIGTQSRGQAYRQGKWAVLTDLLNTDTITFQAGLDSQTVLPGDTIEVADPHWATADFGGRIIQDGSADGVTHIKLDRPIEYAGATSPQLHLTLLHGAVDDVPNIENAGRPIPRELRYFSSGISAYDPATNIVTLATAIPNSTNDGITPLIWIFSKTEQNPRAYKVLHTEENTKDHTYTITGVDYDPNKYVLMDENFHIDYDPGANYSNLPPTAYCPPPTNPKLELLSVGDVWVLHASWTPPADHNFVIGYNVRYKRDDDNWVSFPLVKDNYKEWPAQNGSYIFGVRAVNTFGAQSAEVFNGLAVGANGANAGPLSISSVFTDRGDLTFVDRDIHLYWISLSTVLRAATLNITATVKKAASTTTMDSGAILVTSGTGSLASGAATVDITVPATPIINITGLFDLGDGILVNIGMASFSYQATADATIASAMATGLANVINIDPRFDASVVLDSVVVTFSDVNTNANNVEAHDDPMFFRYRIRVLDADTSVQVRQDYSIIPEYMYSYANNLQDFTTPHRTVKFAISVEDVQHNISAENIVTVYNPPPLLPAIVPEIKSSILTVRYTPPLDPDFAGIIVWMSDIDGFTPAPANQVWHDRGNPAIPLSSSSTYFFRYAAFDRFGEAGIILSQQLSLPAVGKTDGVTFAELFRRWPTRPPAPAGGITGAWSTPHLFDSQYQTWRLQTTSTSGGAFIATDAVAIAPDLESADIILELPVGWLPSIPDWVNSDFGPIWRTTSSSLGLLISAPPPATVTPPSPPVSVIIFSYPTFASVLSYGVIGSSSIVSTGPTGRLDFDVFIAMIGVITNDPSNRGIYATIQYRVYGSSTWTTFISKTAFYSPGYPYTNYVNYIAESISNTQNVSQVDWKPSKSGLLPNKQYEVQVLINQTSSNVYLDKQLLGTAYVEGF